MESLLSSCYSLKDIRQISPEVQTALKQGYAKVCCLLIAYALGFYLHILLDNGCFFTALATFECMLWLIATPPWEEHKRLMTYYLFSILYGASSVSVAKLFIDFDTRMWVSEYIGAAIAFACFSGAAMLERRREFFYLGALLSSGVSIFFWSHFASKIFGGATAYFQSEIYFGLMAVVGCMVVATQVLIPKTWICDAVEQFGRKGTEEEYEDEGDYEQKLHSTTNKNSV
ncbi:unnamed protein product [Lactuca virosa]|uniref:Uncharacterized protein n=1 Tax=Lactuca virosa TaxID=75947 RepID=A0AAU9PUC5_9ASTR|nr:unnamed protein product [Lactuca virosa]CAH1453986.1 unnamed protein product [Lactuca virosa]